MARERRYTLYFLVLCGLSAPAAAKDQQAPSKVVDIPHCLRTIGTAAVRLPPEAKDWWSGQNLSSPETIVKAIVQKSGCFTLVDRGAAMQLADEERARSARGDLRAGSNIGRGQVRAADYIIVPTLLSQNSHAGGHGLGGLLGFIPGIGMAASAIAGGLDIKKKTADVHLEIVDVRSSEVVASADGHAKKQNLSWGAGAGGFGSGGFGAFGASGYTDTEIGQVIMAAYIDAYSRLVADRGGVTALPTVAAAASPAAGAAAAPPPPSAQASVTTIRPGVLRATPALAGKALKTIAAGTVLYPTGQSTGPWLKVADEIGTEGWISSLSVRRQ